MGLHVPVLFVNARVSTGKIFLVKFHYATTVSNITNKMKRIHSLYYNGPETCVERRNSPVGTVSSGECDSHVRCLLPLYEEMVLSETRIQIYTFSIIPGLLNTGNHHFQVRNFYIRGAALAAHIFCCYLLFRHSRHLVHVHSSSYCRRCILWIMSLQSLKTRRIFSVSTAQVKCG